MGLTFRKEKAETGLAGVANPTPATQIKLDKKYVGSISPPTWRCTDEKWVVRLMVKTDDIGKHPGGWRWVTVKQRFDDEPQARAWLQQNLPLIQKTFELHLMEPFND